MLNLGGLILNGSCAAGPNLDVRASSSVPDSMIHVSWNNDPGNVPFYRQDNDLNPVDSFSLLGDNDDASAGTLVYATPAGANVTVTFLSDQGVRARRHGRVRVLRHGASRARATRDTAFRVGAERLAPTRYLARVTPLTRELRAAAVDVRRARAGGRVPAVPARGGDGPVLLLDDPAAADGGVPGRGVLGGLRADRMGGAGGDVGAGAPGARPGHRRSRSCCWPRR